MGEGKRRLPVLQPEGSADEEAARRPAWQWVGIGMGAIFLTWLPLAYVAALVAEALAARQLGGRDPSLVAEAFVQLDDSERLWLYLKVMGPLVVALFLAAAVGGMVLGRFDRRSGPRDAALAGAAVAGLTSLVALGPAISAGVVLSWAIATIIVAGLAAGAAHLGARGGTRGASP